MNRNLGELVKLARDYEFQQISHVAIEYGPLEDFGRVAVVVAVSPPLCDTQRF